MVQIVVKDLLQETTVYEIPDDETVLALKSLIEADKGPRFSVPYQRLIFAGRILENDDVLSTIGFGKPRADNPNEEEFVVLLMARKLAPSIRGAPTPPNTPASSETDISKKKPRSQQQLGRIDSDNRRVVNSADVEAEAILRPILGHKNHEMVTRLVEIGFNWEAADRALKITGFDPDRAVNYLMDQEKANELDDNNRNRVRSSSSSRRSRSPGADPQPRPSRVDKESQTGPELSNGRPQRQSPDSPDAPSSESLKIFPKLTFLRGSPQFEQARRMVQAEPSLLAPMMEHIHQRQPSLFKLIEENAAEFVDMLNEPVFSSLHEQEMMLEMTNYEDLYWRPYRRSVAPPDRELGPRRTVSSSSIEACTDDADRYIEQLDDVSLDDMDLPNASESPAMENLPAAARNARAAQRAITAAEARVRAGRSPRIDEEEQEDSTDDEEQEQHEEDSESSFLRDDPRYPFTHEDREAIRNLMTLGYDVDRAVEAYLACDRDENAAANFLISEDESNGIFRPPYEY